MAKVATICPVKISFWLLSITPLSMSGSTPSENISVCTPRCLWLPRQLSTALGMAPMPICRVAPSSTSVATCSPMAREVSSIGGGAISGSGSWPSVKAWICETWMMPSPWVRGMFRLTWATTRCAVSTTASAVSMLTPSEQ